MNLSKRFSWAQIAARNLLLASVASVHLACVDHSGDYSVSGTVLDSAGQPVPNVHVRRTQTTSSPTLFNKSGRFESTSDARGFFEFEKRGLGQRPEPFQFWHLLVLAPDGRSARLTVSVPWDVARNAYVLHGIEIKLP